jgi:hypothetical protein
LQPVFFFVALFRLVRIWHFYEAHIGFDREIQGVEALIPKDIP